jgi:hypothetical protein
VEAIHRVDGGVDAGVLALPESSTGSMSSTDGARSAKGGSDGGTRVDIVAARERACSAAAVRMC